MDKIQRGKKLNQLSRFLFDSSADKFYSGIAIEFLSGTLGIIASFIEVSNKVKLVLAIIGFTIFAVSYYLKLKSKDEYDSAETMRRQSVLAEALGWDIGTTQYSKWRQKAGRKLLDKEEKNGRSDDYYETDKSLGAERLLEMTQESAFYTRMLYSKLHTLVTIACFVSIGMFIVVFAGLFPLQVFSQDTQITIAYAIYLILPLIITSDLLGWLIKLKGAKDEIFEIEKSLEILSKQPSVQEFQVMQLVSEYNCQVVQGIPIPNFLFNLWYEEIKKLWDTR